MSDLKLYDIVLVQGACTDSNFAKNFNLPGTFSALASWDLLFKAYSFCQQEGIDVTVGNVLSSDIFYNLDSSDWQRWAAMQVIAVEMEAYALYCNAAFAEAEALAILTVSDNLVTGEKTTAKEREVGFAKMMQIALSLI